MPTSQIAGSAPAERFGAGRLHRDAVLLACSYCVSAGFGMVFWATAAHLIPPERLGVMTAVLAAITGPALVLAAGIGDAYTSLMPVVGDARHAVYRRGQRIYLVAATLCGIVGGLATVLLIDEVHTSIMVVLLVAVGTVVVAGFSLQNNTLIAIGRARWMLAVNGSVGLLRVALLVLFAMAFVWHSVELAFILSAALILVALQPSITRIIGTSDGLPETALLTHDESTSEFNRFVIRSFAAVALSLGMLAITPFLVTAFAGARQGALFALSLSIVQTLDFVGSALGVSLAVHASSAPETAEVMARSVLIKALGLTVAGAIGVVALGPLVLTSLNAEYHGMGAAGVIAALAAGSVLRTVFMVWAALQRSRRRMRALLLSNLCATTVLLSTLPWLARSHGAFGGALALLLAQTLLSGIAIAHFVFTRSKSEGHASA